MPRPAVATAHSRGSRTRAAINDVIVQVHASGFTGDELTWPATALSSLRFQEEAFCQSPAFLTRSPS
jgi:hypothetical protein